MSDQTTNHLIPYPTDDDPLTAFPALAADMADVLDDIVPPVGSIMEYNGSVAPDGWLLCDGAEYDTDAYQSLAMALDDAGGFTFRVPDLAKTHPAIIWATTYQVTIPNYAATHGWKSGTGSITFPQGLFDSPPVVVATAEDTFADIYPVICNTRDVSKTHASLYVWGILPPDMFNAPTAGNAIIRVSVMAMSTDMMDPGYIIRHGERP